MEQEARAVRDLAKAYAGLRREVTAARRELAELRREAGGAVLCETYGGLRQEVAALAEAYAGFRQSVDGLEDKTVTVTFVWRKEGEPPDLDMLQQISARLRG
jgi:hypothetical protein